MPAYHVDLTTDRGLQRVPFTLDDERPLGGQVRNVLEELRQRGLVLRGGPEDELTVVWSGRELDLARSPQSQGITPMYPLELRMRNRAVARARKEPPPQPFLAKAAYLGPVAGFTGAAIGWALSSLLTDLGDVINSYGALDLTVATLLGGSIGAFVLGFDSNRRGQPFALGLGLGLILGALGAGLGAFFGLALSGFMHLGGSRQSFALARLLTWSVTGAFTGLLLGLAWIRTERRRLLDGSLYGLVAGILGGLLGSLPGPTDFWQSLGFAALGASIGAGLVLPGIRRSLGVIGLETSAGRSVGFLRHREWEIAEHGATRFGRRFTIEANQGRLKLVPSGPDGGGERATVGDRAVSGPADLLNEDVLTLGDRKYRFRRFPDRTV